MALAKRCSELQAVTRQFKHRVQALHFILVRKNQKPTQTNNPWYIPAVPTGMSEFGAPNCPVRYYHGYVQTHRVEEGQTLFVHPN